jgi:hypothetical protein
LAAWINPDSLAAAQPTWGMGIVKSTVNAGAIGDFMLSVDDGGSLHFSNWRTTGADATGVNFSADGVISTSQWTHVAGTWDGSVNRIYVNGSEVLISGTENSGSGWLTESTIGRLFPGGGGAYHFDGRIDDVGIWNETLDSDQIGIIYANGLNGLDLAFVAPPVPEPSCALLLALGMIPVARRARRRNRNSAQ